MEAMERERNLGKDEGVSLYPLGPLDGVEENGEAVPVLPGSLSSPARVLGAANMALGVRHQGKDTP